MEEMDNKPQLTPKQDGIYRFIQEYVEANHTPPSLREIGRRFKVSVGTIQDQVKALCKKGFINKEDWVSRGLRLASNPLEIPILGRVHAGPLHAAIEDVEGTVPGSAGMSRARYFGLRVRGDSMTQAGILEGDVVLVRAQPVANEGDIVVARVEDETTVKRLKKHVLYPANPKYSPIHGPFEILGVVVEVRRRLSK